MKTRKVNRRKRIRRNKTIRGGIYPILGDTPPRLFKDVSHNNKKTPETISRSVSPESISLSTSPNQYEDLKYKDDKYLHQILEFTNTTKQQFEEFVSEKNPNKSDIKMFFKNRLIEYLQTKFIKKQVIILKSYFDTDDFDAIMDQYVE